MRHRVLGLVLVALGSAAGAGIARDPSPLLRTAVTVAGTLLVVLGAFTYVRGGRSEERT